MRSVFVGQNVRQNVLLFGRMFAEHFLDSFNQSETSVIDQLLGDYWRYFAPPFEYNGFYRLEPPTYFRRKGKSGGFLLTQSSDITQVKTLQKRPFGDLFYSMRDYWRYFASPWNIMELYRPVWTSPCEWFSKPNFNASVCRIVWIVWIVFCL